MKLTDFSYVLISTEFEFALKVSVKLKMMNKYIKTNIFTDK